MDTVGIDNDMGIMRNPAAIWDIWETRKYWEEEI
jgi:hypothetical protein